MLVWFHHFSYFAFRIFVHWYTFLGTSPGGVVAQIAVLLLTEVHGGWWNWKTWRVNWQGGLRRAAYALGSVWVIAFLACIVTTTYDDHRDLAARFRDVVNEKNTLKAGLEDRDGYITRLEQVNRELDKRPVSCPSCREVQHKSSLDIVCQHLANCPSEELSKRANELADKIDAIVESWRNRTKAEIENVDKLAGPPPGKYSPAFNAQRDAIFTGETYFARQAYRKYRTTVNAMRTVLPDLALVIIDPITNYLAGVNMNREDEVREILMQVVDNLVTPLRVSVMTIGHLNKRERGTDPKDRVMGARAFYGVARFVYFCGDDEDAPAEDKHSHVMTQDRGVGAQAIRYRTEAVDQTWAGQTSKVVRIVWGNKCNVDTQSTVDQLSKGDKRLSAESAAFIREVLKSGKKPAQEVQDQHKKALGRDCSDWTRARRLANVGTIKEGSAWFWYIKTETTAPIEFDSGKDKV